MRLWSLHPKYLDAKGLVALWREALLAQHVLNGKTRGYTRHPQLIRFRSVKNPVGAIARYLRQVADEAEKRNYRFDQSKIVHNTFRGSIAVTNGQLEYEFAHLLGKLEKRDPERYSNFKNLNIIEHHDLFRAVPGEREEWEKGI
jgi:hypothetical protein